MKILHKDGETQIAAITSEDIARLEAADKYEKVLRDISELIRDVLAIKPVAKPEIKTGKKRGPYKKRTPSAAPKVKEPGTRGPSMVDKAIDIMRRMQRPCIMDDIVEAMQNSGIVFSAKKPTDSLGVQLNQSGRAKVVAKNGKKGLWDIVGEEVKTAPTSSIDKEKRLQMIRDAHQKTM